MGLRDYSLYDFIQHNAAAAGSAPAIISANLTITHKKFLERVDQLAAGYREQGSHLHIGSKFIPIFRALWSLRKNRSYRLPDQLAVVSC